MLIGRRTLLADIGKGAFALSVVTVAGCTPAAVASLGPSAPASGAANASASPPSSPDAVASPTDPAVCAAAFAWERVNLGRHHRRADVPPVVSSSRV